MPFWVCSSRNFICFLKSLEMNLKKADSWPELTGVAGWWWEVRLSLFLPFIFGFPPSCFSPSFPFFLPIFCSLPDSLQEGSDTEVNQTESLPSKSSKSSLLESWSVNKFQSSFISSSVKWALFLLHQSFWVHVPTLTLD